MCLLESEDYFRAMPASFCVVDMAMQHLPPASQNFPITFEIRTTQRIFFFLNSIIIRDEIFSLVKGIKSSTKAEEIVDKKYIFR